MTRFSTAIIKQLFSSKKIRGFRFTGSPTTKIPVPTALSPQKEWLELTLQYWCNEQLLLLQRERRFASDRKWRFDWAITDPDNETIKIAVEYEGIYSAKSRHTTHKGFTGDIEKYNRAAQEGWKVLRFTAKNYKTLINELNGCIKNKS